MNPKKSVLYKNWDARCASSWRLNWAQIYFLFLPSPLTQVTLLVSTWQRFYIRWMKSQQRSEASRGLFPSSPVQNAHLFQLVFFPYLETRTNVAYNAPVIYTRDRRGYCFQWRPSRTNPRASFWAVNWAASSTSNIRTRNMYEKSCVLGHLRARWGPVYYVKPPNSLKGIVSKHDKKEMSFFYQ
jgi:hypothetical protein